MAEIYVVAVHNIEVGEYVLVILFCRTREHVVASELVFVFSC